MSRVHTQAGYPFSLLVGKPPVRITRITLVLNKWEAMVWDRGHLHEPMIVSLSALKNQGGRPPETEDMADFVHERKPPNGDMTMKQIGTAWATAFPEDSRTSGLSPLKRAEKLREAWRRHYGDKIRAKPERIFNPPRRRL